MPDRAVAMCLRILFGKESETMMAMLWAQKIMSAATMADAHALYGRVPRLLREKVRAILVESGMDELMAEE